MSTARIPPCKSLFDTGEEPLDEGYDDTGPLKTVLQEVYRLTTSQSAGGVSGQLAATETADAFSFAERAWRMMEP